MIEVAGLPAAVRRHVRVAGRQGWRDGQMIGAVIALDPCGGERVEDLERLAADAGFGAVLRAVERRRLVRRGRRRRMKSRLRRGGGRAVASPAALSAWLERFHDAGQEAKREAGRGLIARPSAAWLGWWRVDRARLSSLQGHRRQAAATLDMDPTLVESHERQALCCYKKLEAYQPLSS